MALWRVWITLPLVVLLLLCSSATAYRATSRVITTNRAERRNTNIISWSATRSSSSTRRYPSWTLPILRSSTNNDAIIHHESINTKGFSISYVGRGSSAIVRKGSLLIAPSQEYHHLLSKAAIFIYDVGLDDENNELVARGVIIDHPTAFSISEMVDDSYFQNEEGIAATIGKNTLFRGGDLGEEFVMVLHSLHPNHPSQEMIGSSGIYQGGLSNIIDAINRGDIVCDTTNSIKFFFNYLEFTENQLNLMFHDDDDDTNQQGSIDSWLSVEVLPSSFILHNGYNRGSAWEKIRNYVRLNNL